MNGLSRAVIGCAINVHRALGPGLLESVYESCMAEELRVQGLPFERQVPISLTYRGLRIERGYRMDLVVDGQIVVEIKAVHGFDPIHSAQLLTYLRLSACPLGLLLNFNMPVLKDGITRLVNEFPDCGDSLRVA